MVIYLGSEKGKLWKIEIISIILHWGVLAVGKEEVCCICVDIFSRNIYYYIFIAAD